MRNSWWRHPLPRGDNKTCFDSGYLSPNSWLPGSDIFDDDDDDDWGLRAVIYLKQGRYNSRATLNCASRSFSTKALSSRHLQNLLLLFGTARSVCNAWPRSKYYDSKKIQLMENWLASHNYHLFAEKAAAAKLCPYLLIALIASAVQHDFERTFTPKTSTCSRFHIIPDDNELPLRLDITTASRWMGQVRQMHRAGAHDKHSQRKQADEDDT